MRTDLDIYLDELKNRGFDIYQISLSEQSENTVSILDDQVENQTIGKTTAISGRVLLDGKVGVFSTDRLDEETPSLMADSLYESAKYGKEEERENFYDGKGKYHRAETALKEFVPADLKAMRDLGLELSHFASSLDKRIKKVSVTINMSDSSSHKVNNLGLDCKTKMRCYIGSIEILAVDEEGTHQSGYAIFSSFKNLTALRQKGIEATYRAVRDATDFFGAEAVKSGEYEVVLAPSVVSSLLGDLVSHMSAKAVMQHLSLFEDKIGTKIASEALTILHTPHVTSLDSTPYDAEGVPTTDFTLVEKGVLKTYLHSLETARYFRTEPNGCGSGNGNADAIVLTIKPGSLSQRELFKKVSDGLYIDDVSGLNSGINSTSLDFSLPCRGYVIKDGELDEPVNMIIMAGNLLDLFSSITDVGSDVDTLFEGGIITPSIALSRLSIAGK